MLAGLALLAVEISVVSASPSVGNTVHVSVRVANETDAPYVLQDASLVLLDPQGKRFTAIDVTDEIPAGATRQVGVVFVVSKEFPGAQLTLESIPLEWMSPAFGLVAEDIEVRMPPSNRPARSNANRGGSQGGPYLPGAELLEALIKRR